MGYYTAFGLRMEGDPEEITAVEQELLEATKCGGEIDGCVQELIDTGTVYAKLYKLEDQITPVAKKHPEVLIILTGDGEDSDDMWEVRWKGEEVERQKAIIPPFNNRNLYTEAEKVNL